METPETPKVVAIVSDLIFSSKIMGAARAVGIDARTIRQASQLPESAPRLLLVDLSLPGVIDSIQSWRQTHAVKTIGFASHVDAPTIDAAREAGMLVMARSGFVEALPKLLEDAKA